MAPGWELVTRISKPWLAWNFHSPTPTSSGEKGPEIKLVISHANVMKSLQNSWTTGSRELLGWWTHPRAGTLGTLTPQGQMLQGSGPSHTLPYMLLLWLFTCILYNSLRNELANLSKAFPWVLRALMAKYWSWGGGHGNPWKGSQVRQKWESPISPLLVVGIWSGGGGGAWVAQLVERLPSAQVMILHVVHMLCVWVVHWVWVQHQAPCSTGSLLLPLPIPSACTLSLSK